MPASSEDGVWLKKEKQKLTKQIASIINLHMKKRNVKVGQFVEQGTSEDIFRHPRHPYTKALLSANPNPDPDAQSDRLDLAGEVPSLLNVPSGCEFHTRCPFVQTDCRESVPVSREAAPGHVFQCHYPLKED